jgi:hypothetical protein
MKSRNRKLGSCLALLVLTSNVSASTLFEDNSLLEITLTGPLNSMVRRPNDREEYPFVLSVGGVDLDVDVRIRGKSRVVVCLFPPLRLDFKKKGNDHSVFRQQDKLKLVTHCKNDSARAENSLLNEYLAYRIFNLISDKSYRVRLLKVKYEDTLGKQRHLDRPYFGFLIESDKDIAKRLGGKVAVEEGVRYSLLDQYQTALLNVFYYLIGNKDWSLIKAEESDSCCHNLDLIDVDRRLVPIPYDFDLSGIADALYTGPNRRSLNRFIKRKYNGHCKSPVDMVGEALGVVSSLEVEIMDEASGLPASKPSYLKKRIKFLQEFFEEARDEEALLREFEKDCVGRRL